MFPDGYKIIEDPEYIVRAGDYFKLENYDWLLVSPHGDLKDRTIQYIKNCNKNISFMKQPVEKKEIDKEALKLFNQSLLMEIKKPKVPRVPKIKAPAPYPAIPIGFRALNQDELEGYIFREGDYFLNRRNDWEVITAWSDNPVTIAKPHSRDEILRVLVPINRQIKSAPKIKVPKGYRILENADDRELNSNDRFLSSYESDILDGHWQKPTSFAGKIPSELKKQYGYKTFIVVVPTDFPPFTPKGLVVPKGYTLLEDSDNYALTHRDKFIYEGRATWSTPTTFQGQTPRDLKEKYSYKFFHVAVPIEGYIPSAPPPPMPALSAANIEVPDGYEEIVENLDDYIFKKGDKITHRGNGGIWSTITSYAGYSVENVINDRGWRNLRVITFTNKPPKKRFESPYAYPHGY